MASLIIVKRFYRKTKIIFQQITMANWLIFFHCYLWSKNCIFILNVHLRISHNCFSHPACKNIIFFWLHCRQNAYIITTSLIESVSWTSWGLVNTMPSRGWGLVKSCYTTHSIYLIQSVVEMILGIGELIKKNNFLLEVLHYNTRASKMFE